MDDALLVRRRQAERHLQPVLDHPARRHRLSLDLVAQRLPFEQLGDEVGQLRVLAHVVDGDDVGMAEHAGGARFDLEPAHQIAVARQRLGQHLQGDVAAQARVAGAVDHAHRSRAELTDDLVGSETLA